MKREEWQRIKEVLHTALDIPGAERPAYLDKTCNGNAELRREVESLLASHDEAGTFIEDPVVKTPRLTPPQPDSLRIGAGLGPYRIV